MCMCVCVCVCARACLCVYVCVRATQACVCVSLASRADLYFCMPAVCVTCVTCRKICMHSMHAFMHTNIQAYRHLLFNRMAYCEHGLRFRDLQLALFVIVTEAYSKTQSQPHAKKGCESFAFCGLKCDVCSLYARTVIRKASHHRMTCAILMHVFVSSGGQTWGRRRLGKATRLD